jgi:hypothetical protein
MKHAALLRTAAVSALSALVLALAPSVASAATVELLTNGGFDDIGAGVPEGWGGLTYYAGGPVSLPGWTVGSGSVDLTDTSSVWGPAGSGQYSLDINGWNAGLLSQSFKTVLGRVYTVSFNYSRNPANAPYTATATVTAGGQGLDVTALGDGGFGGMSSMLWQTGQFSFQGTGGTQTIALAATIPGNAGVFFDNVSVSGAVPEPASWALMIGGFGLTGAALRRRRASSFA